MDLKEKVEESKKMIQTFSAFTYLFNRIDLDITILEDFEREKSIYLNENTVISVLIGKGNGNATHTLISTDDQREVLDILNFLENIFIKRTEETLWDFEDKKEKLMEFLK